MSALPPRFKAAPQAFPAPNRNPATDALLLFLIVLAGAGPFLSKAVHVDDPYYLAVARNVLRDPTDPYAGRAPWGYGEWFAVNSNPALWTYLLAGVAAAAGWSEGAFHVVAALAYAAFVVGSFALLARLSARPLPWTAATAFAPFLLPGRNLMVDVPMLALWVWSVELAFRHWEAGGARDAWLAGSLAGLAILTKYTGILLLPLLAIGSLRGKRFAGAIALLAPAAVLVGAWTAFLFFRYGELPIGSQRLGGVGDWGVRLRVLVRGVGGVVWWTPFWWIALASRSKGWAGLAAGLAAAAGLWGWVDARLAAEALSGGGFAPSGWRDAHFFLFSANGLLALALPTLLAGASMRSLPLSRRRVVQTLLAWAALDLAFNLFVLPSTPFGAVRHLAVFALPLFWAAIPGTEAAGRSKLLFWNLAATAALGFALAHADLRIAAVYRDLAREIVAPLAAERPTWIVGDPSFRYYAEPAGARPWLSSDLDPGAMPSRGDAIVVPFLQSVGRLGGWSEPLAPAPSAPNPIRVSSANPLRTISQTANYYGGSATSLPWEIARPRASVFAGAAAWPPIEEVRVLSRVGR